MQSHYNVVVQIITVSKIFTAITLIHDSIHFKVSLFKIIWFSVYTSRS